MAEFYHGWENRQVYFSFLGLPFFRSNAANFSTSRSLNSNALPTCRDTGSLSDRANCWILALDRPSFSATCSVVRSTIISPLLGYVVRPVFFATLFPGPLSPPVFRHKAEYREYSTMNLCRCKSTRSACSHCSRSAMSRRRFLPRDRPGSSGSIRGR